MYKLFLLGGSIKQEMALKKKLFKFAQIIHVLCKKIRKYKKAKMKIKTKRVTSNSGGFFFLTQAALIHLFLFLYSFSKL